MSTELAGRVAIVTGGARGIGEAVARKLAEAGARVVATDLREGELAAAGDILRKAGYEVLDLAHDVTSEAAWQAVVSATLSAFGRLDILINNAGIAGTGRLVETSLAQWRTVMAVNCDGVFLGMRTAIPVMTKGTGSIVNVSSIMGLVAHAGAGPYCASKGAVRMMTKAAALECAADGSGIRVNSVHPGFIETPLLDEGLRTGPDGDAAVAAIRALHPIGRLGLSDEIGDAVVFLASDRSSFMTGSELVVDGGYTSV